jgi:hypothetical protein
MVVSLSLTVRAPLLSHGSNVPMRVRSRRPFRRKQRARRRRNVLIAVPSPAAIERLAPLSVMRVDNVARTHGDQPMLAFAREDT